MGKINIIGGSHLRMNFEIEIRDPGGGTHTETSPGDFAVELVQHGDRYRVVRTDGGRFETAQGNSANMEATTAGGTGNTTVVVEYADL